MDKIQVHSKPYLILNLPSGSDRQKERYFRKEDHNLEFKPQNQKHYWHLIEVGPVKPRCFKMDSVESVQVYIPFVYIAPGGCI